MKVREEKISHKVGIREDYIFSEREMEMTLQGGSVRKLSCLDLGIGWEESKHFSREFVNTSLTSKVCNMNLLYLCGPQMIKLRV